MHMRDNLRRLGREEPKEELGPAEAEEFGPTEGDGEAEVIEELSSKLAQYTTLDDGEAESRIKELGPKLMTGPLSAGEIKELGPKLGETTGPLGDGEVKELAPPALVDGETEDSEAAAVELSKKFIALMHMRDNVRKLGKEEPKEELGPGDGEVKELGPNLGDMTEGNESKG